MTSHKEIRKKLLILSYSTLGMSVIIFTKLFLLQIILNRPLLEKSKKNYLKFEAIRSRRGNITDRNGILLATNRPVIHLYWNGTGNYRLSAEQKKVLEYIEQILHMSLPDSTLNQIGVCERRYKTFKIAHDISLEQLMEIEELCGKHPNIFTKTDFKRHYPFSSLACHILGYINKNEDAGFMGLEQLCNNQLQGTQGICVQATNSMGRTLKKKTICPAHSGTDIITTLDIRLQKILESIFPKQYAGTALLMNPHDGDIVALVSRPNFDPDFFLHPILNQDWAMLQKDHPFINRAFSACYPPGSVFKLITASAALEHNIIKPDTTWHCNGYYMFGNRKYWCHKRRGHGVLTARQALAQSCNVVFYEIAKQLSIDILADYSKQFGLGVQTHIIFPEKIGLIPTKEWKYMSKGERWWPGETLLAAIGQSFLLVTPIQIARMISAIFTGYLTKPRILISESIEQTTLPIQHNTLQFLQDSMKKVVKKGTGQQVNHIKNMHVYAKTSTAQTSTLQKRFLGKEYQEHGLLVSFFQYKELQPLTLVVLIEHAGSARVATHVAKQFLLQYKLLIDKSDQP